MKCDICRERPAVIFVQQISKDSSIELHLCEACAKERGFSTTENKIDISLGGLFSEALKPSGTSGDKDAACRSCGMALGDIRRNLRVGCADCYRQFRGEIIALLRREGIELSYDGQLPSETKEPSERGVDTETLRKELRDAIAREDYELAAYYRDRLRSIEGGAR
jgi:protein arginine kinase activator